MSGVESTSIPSSTVISAAFANEVPVNEASICAVKLRTSGAPPAGKKLIVAVCGGVILNPVPLKKFKPVGKLSVTSTNDASNDPSLVTVISYVTKSPTT